jgi:hypothetical protein
VSVVVNHGHDRRAPGQAPPRTSGRLTFATSTFHFTRPTTEST